MFTIQTGPNDSVVVKHEDGAQTQMFHPNGAELKVTGYAEFELIVPTVIKYRVFTKGTDGMRTVGIERVEPKPDHQGWAR